MAGTLDESGDEKLLSMIWRQAVMHSLKFFEILQEAGIKLNRSYLEAQGLRARQENPLSGLSLGVLFTSKRDQVKMRCCRSLKI